MIENNQIHDLHGYRPELSETPTQTTWSADGKTMTNPNANWEVDTPFGWVNSVELWVKSGNNVLTGDNDVTVATVISPTKIVLEKSIKKDSEGVTPLNVDYLFVAVTHTDLIQVFAGGTTSNLTIRGNQFYDFEGQITWINPQNTGNPGWIGGYNFLIENNLCWKSYADGQSEYFGVFNLEHIDGLVVRNNIVIGRLNIGACINAEMHGNIVGYLSTPYGTVLSANDYNIFNRGNFEGENTIGEHSLFLNEGYSWDKWNASEFTDIFVDYAGGDFRPLMSMAACNGSVNDVGVAVGALPCA